MVGLGEGSDAQIRQAALYWDADGNVIGDNTTTNAGLGGNGTWNTTSALWWDGSSSALTTWPNTGSDTAIFTGSAGVGILNTPITVGTLVFNTTGFNITDDGTAGAPALGGGSRRFRSISPAQTPSSAVLASSGRLNLSSNTTGTLALTNTGNTFSGTVSITSGKLVIATDGSLGNALNGITFNGAVATGLTLNTPVVLSAPKVKVFPMLELPISGAATAAHGR